MSLGHIGINDIFWFGFKVAKSGGQNIWIRFIKKNIWYTICNDNETNCSIIQIFDKIVTFSLRNTQKFANWKLWNNPIL